MPNAAAHAMAATLAVGGTIAATTDTTEKDGVLKIAAGGAMGTLGAKLPDLLEPALNPHHRQFFHSVVFAVGLGVAVHKVYKWQTSTKTDEWIRLLILAGISGYLLHLIMDGFTPRSLPMVGRLPG